VADRQLAHPISRTFPEEFVTHAPREKKNRRHFSKDLADNETTLGSPLGSDADRIMAPLNCISKLRFLSPILTMDQM